MSDNLLLYTHLVSGFVNAVLDAHRELDDWHSVFSNNSCIYWIRFSTCIPTFWPEKSNTLSIQNVLFSQY
jgi:hypothetical protein